MENIWTLTMNPSLDKSTRIKRVTVDRKLRCDPPHYEPGGGGINVSRAIHRLGGTSLAFYPRGGSMGEMLENLIVQESIQQHPLAIQGTIRANFTVFEEDTGGQYRFVMPGPTLMAKEWQSCLDAIFGNRSPPDYIVASGSLPRGVPQDFYGQLARLSHKAGCRTIVDSSGEELIAAAREGVYLLKPNMREMQHLAGGEIESEEQLESVAQQLIEDGKSEVIVISLGAAGALLVTAQNSEMISSPTVSIQSKIGAGDSMVAGLTLALSRGESLCDAVRFGVAAGAAAVSTPGTELCPRNKTEQLYEKMVSKVTQN